MSLFPVRVIPNASRSEIVGYEQGAWKIRLAAPPVDGKANEALIRFLADALDLAPSEVEVVKGHTSKMKTISVPMHEEDVKEKMSS
jgi:uncharacterized protein